MATNNNDNISNSKWRWKKIFQYFVQGLLVTAPIAITFYLLYAFISSIDNLLPIFTFKDERGQIITRNYGLGFLIIIFALIFIGFLSSNFITRRIFSLFDEWLERAPGIKFVYSSIKDFFEAFAGNKRKFNKAVLVALHQPDVYQIGFVTDDDASEFDLVNYATVYIPFSYSFAGKTYLIPKDRIKPIEHVSAADAMKYVVSGGIAEVEDDHHHTIT
jgi:uncharacterized membrane protein